MSGVMFRQLSLVVAFSLLCSFVSAITLVPMLASHILRRSVHHGDEVGHWTDHFLHWSSRLLGNLEEGYGKLVAVALRHRALVVLLAVTTLGLVLLLLPLIGTELMPKTDESQVRVYAEMEVGTRVENVDRVMREIDRIVVAEVPEMTSRVSRCGSSGWHATGGHKGQLTINLVPVSQRKRSSVEIALDLAKKLSNLPGVKVRTREGQGLFLLRMASSSGENLAIDVRGHDFDNANLLSNQISRLAEEVPGVTDTQISRDVGTPEREIRIDRRKAADMKLSVEQIADTLRTVLAGTQAGNFREGGDEYFIRVRVKGAEQMAIQDVLDLTVVNQDGEPVVMRNVVDTVPTTGPVIIERKDQERTVSVATNIAERDMGSVVRDIRGKLHSLAMPPGFAVTIAGDYEDQQEAFHELLFSFALAVLLVYMVMACQFESLRDPFVIMFAVPFSAIGVILILLLTDTTLNVQSAIGCIILAGIVVNNAILLVDHTNLLRRRDGLALHEAIAEAGRRRLRPILMTALTTSLALVPLALGLGEGGEAQAPMARAVIGGMLSSTLITLVLVPVLYSLMESWHRRRNGEGDNHPMPSTGTAES
jgi:HAE1 family hydrophobic/amphiphilic exporter-1